MNISRARNIIISISICNCEGHLNSFLLAMDFTGIFSHLILSFLILKTFVKLCVSSSISVSPNSLESISQIVLDSLGEEFFKKFEILHFNSDQNQGPCKFNQAKGSVYQNLFGCYNFNTLKYILGQTNFEDDLLFIIRTQNEIEFSSVLTLINECFVHSSQSIKHYFLLQWPSVSENNVDKVSQFSSSFANSVSRINLQTNVYIFFQRNDSVSAMKNLEFWEFYHIKETLVFRQLEMNSRSDYMIQAKVPRRQNCQGELIVAVAAEAGEYPFEVSFRNVTTLLGEKHYELVDGLAVSIYRDFKMMLNFSESALGGDEIQVRPDGTLGGISARYFASGDGDILISHNAHRPSASKLVTYLQPNRLEPVNAYSKRPALKMRTTIFVDTFETKVWICLICFCLGIVLSLNIILWVRSHILKFREQFSGTGANLEILSWMLGTVCQQGRHLFSSAFPVQIILITAHLTMVILYCAYSAKLVSNLSVKIPEIRSFEDFLHKKYQLISDEASVSMVRYGKNLKEYYGDKLHSEIQVHKSLDLMKTLMTTKSALLTFDDDMTRYYGWHTKFPDRFACSSILSYSAEIGFPTRVGMVLPKSSPFKEVFNYKIILLMTSGLNHRYNKIYERQTKPQCVEPTLGQLLEPTELNEVVSALFVLAFGFISSGIILLTEKSLKRS